MLINVSKLYAEAILWILAYHWSLHILERVSEATAESRLLTQIFHIREEVHLRLVEIVQKRICRKTGRLEFRLVADVDEADLEGVCCKGLAGVNGKEARHCNRHGPIYTMV